MFDLNDFDEAHPGAWEWDLRRLIASVHVAGRQNGSSEDECGEAVRRCVSSYREHLAHLAAQPLLDPRLRPAEPRPAAPHRGRRGRTAGDRERRRARPQAHERPRPPPVHRTARRRAAPRGGTAGHHPARSRAVRAHRGRPRRVPDDPAGRSGRSSSAATGWSTSRTRSSASARSGSGPTSRSARAPARTTSCSCSSSRRGGPWSRSTCTATRRGTTTRGSASWSTSRRCRRSATRCSAGRRSASASTTCASSAT